MVEAAGVTQVMVEDAADFEAFAELEAEYQIPQFAGMLEIYMRFSTRLAGILRSCRIWGPQYADGVGR